MKFKLEFIINKPLMDVWKAFDDLDNLKKWQPSLVKHEPVSGITGQPGAVSKLTYEESGREFSLTEKVLIREGPTRFDGTYENSFADNTVRNTFIEQGENKTLWVLENEFKFKTITMKIVGPFVKKNFVARSQKDMERFNELVESL